MDDLLTANNPALPLLTYTNQSLAGFSGLYPPSLNLQLSAQGDSVPYLDLLIFPANSDSRCPLTTHLYDKRRRPEFATVDIIRFPHISSIILNNNL